MFGFAPYSAAPLSGVGLPNPPEATEIGFTAELGPLLGTISGQARIAGNVPLPEGIAFFSWQGVEEEPPVAWDEGVLSWQGKLPILENYSYTRGQPLVGSPQFVAVDDTLDQELWLEGMPVFGGLYAYAIKPTAVLVASTPLVGDFTGSVDITVPEITEVGQDHSTLWSISLEVPHVSEWENTTFVGADHSAGWGVTEPVEVDHVSVWGVGDLVEATHSVVWGNADAVNCTHVAEWADLVEVQKLFLSEWDSSALVSSEFVGSWGDLALVGLDHQVVWGNTGGVTQVHEASWGSTLFVGREHTSSWENLLSVAYEHICSWESTTSVSFSHASPWGDTAQIVEPHSSAWGDTTGVVGVHIGSWSSVTSVQADHSSSWASTQPVSGTHTSAWGGYSKLEVEHVVIWENTGGSEGVHVLGWGDTTEVLGTHVSAWAGTSSILVEHFLTWGETSSTSGAHEATWGDLNPIVVDHSFAWGDTTLVGVAHVAGWSGFNSIDFSWVAEWASTDLVEAEHLSGWGSLIRVEFDHESAWGNTSGVTLEHSLVWADTTEVLAAHEASWASNAQVGSEFIVSWDYMTLVEQEHEAPWLNVVDTSGENLAPWGLLVRDQASSDLVSSWSLLSDASTLSVENVPVVTWQGEAVSIEDVTLSSDEGSSVWLAENLVVSDLSLFSRIQIGDEIQLDILGEVWVLRVDGKSLKTVHGNQLGALSAVSPLAWLDSPYSSPIELLEVSEKVSAKDVVTTLLAPVGTVEWNILEWKIPANALSISNATPLRAARTIVEAIGAVLESDPDGTPIVRMRHPVSVPQYANTDADYEIEAGGIFGIKTGAYPLSGYNRVTLSNDANVASTQEKDRLIEVKDDDSLYRSTVKAWLYPWRAVALAHTGHPDTNIEPLGEVITTHSELVEFIGGRGSVATQVYKLDNVSWQHVDLGDVTFLDSELTASLNGQSLAWVTYKTRTYDWRVTLEQNEAVQFVLV